jgi:hypothetical protein
LCESERRLDQTVAVQRAIGAEIVRRLRRAQHRRPQLARIEGGAVAWNQPLMA